MLIKDSCDTATRVMTSCSLVIKVVIGVGDVVKVFPVPFCCSGVSWVSRVVTYLQNMMALHVAQCKSKQEGRAVAGNHREMRGTCAERLLLHNPRATQ